MSDTQTIGFPEAARRLGVPLRVLRRAIRAGKIPAPPQNAATAGISPAWLTAVEQAVTAQPSALSRSARPKVPPFARYEGTSAWRKFPKRVREYAHFRAKAKPA